METIETDVLVVGAGPAGLTMAALLARLAAEELLVEQALESGLLDRADQRARLVIDNLIRSLGYTDVEVVTGS